MSSVNRVILIGNVGQEIAAKEVGGVKVVNFSIACGEKYKDKDGNVVEKTEWVNIVAWQKLAEIIEKYVKKGDQIFIEGRLQTRKYEKDGQTHYATDVRAENMTMLGGKRDAGSNELPSQNTPPPASGNSGDDSLPF